MHAWTWSGFVLPEDSISCTQRPEYQSVCPQTRQRTSGSGYGTPWGWCSIRHDRCWTQSYERSWGWT
jgi:hypothetical protein